MIGRLKAAIRRAQHRIRTIVTLDKRRRGRIKQLRAQAPPRFGIDFAYGHISTAALRDAGVSFVCRYLSPDPAKNLSRGEAAVYAAAGIDSVVVYEGNGQIAGEVRAIGVIAAGVAMAQARACGMPAGRPIYFAVDEETTAEAVAEFFAGADSVLGRAGTGVYGSYAVCAGLFDRGLVGYAWQTDAWSNGLWDRRCQLQQYSNGHTLAGVAVDYDRSTHVDFGQWQPR